MSADYDIAIIGGGPAGSTTGTLLAKYNPNLRIVILEREQFPRDHVGESQLPLICRILDEMGVWDKVEAAGFPIKVGGTYRWGNSGELFDIEFLPDGKLDSAPRPGKYAGQRLSTAFQVDRSIYDKILLDHAEDLGCIVRQSTSVRHVLLDGDRVDGLVLGDGSRITARFYVDASGHSGILRRALNVGLDYPSNLQNIAIWNYWNNAEWATHIGVGGTRIQVLAQNVGWLWFIPLGPERTSIGLVIPAKYYKEQGQRPEDIYNQALSFDSIVSKLIRNAQAEPTVRSTKDWSFVSERLTGENWFLVGECAGFADPILSAGMSLAHSGAREVAYAILAMDRGEYDAEWLRTQYCVNHRGHIRQHIRFADYWYTACGEYSGLWEHARDIAKDAGLKMSAAEAWQWLGQGGFIDSAGSTDIGFFGSLVTKELISSFTGEATYYEIEGKSHFKLDLEGAERDWVADLSNGKITRYRAYRRGNKVLPLVKAMGWIARFLMEERSFGEIKVAAKSHAASMRMNAEQYHFFWSQCIKCLETLVSYGWATARTEPDAEACPRYQADLAQMIHPNRDVNNFQSEFDKV